MLTDKPRILGVVVSLPEDLNPQTIPSVLSQTFPVDNLLMITERVVGGTLAQKISYLLNQGLKGIVEEYDYIFRVDGDIAVPPNFLKENLKGEPDYVGTLGSACLIKVEAFKKALGVRFHPDSDDSYTMYKFMSLGFDVRKYIVNPIFLRRHDLKYGVYDFLERGRIMWKVGYEPLHTTIPIFHKDWRNIITVFSYFAHALRRTKRWDVADFVFRKQIRRLLGWR